MPSVIPSQEKWEASFAKASAYANTPPADKSAARVAVGNLKFQESSIPSLSAKVLA
jgi:hypothetical protein